MRSRQVTFRAGLTKVPPLGEHVEALKEALGVAEELCPAELCADPLPLLAAVIGALGETEKKVEEEKKEAAQQQVRGAIR